MSFACKTAAGVRTGLWIAWMSMACLASPAGASPNPPLIHDEPITAVPQPDPADRRKLALGEALFNDTRLSRDGTVSCASCHDLQSNGAMGSRPVRTPSGQAPRFDTTTVFNAALSFRLNWEGKARTLEAQADDTLKQPDIMASSADEAVAKLRADFAARRAFEAAYGHGPDAASLLDAIAMFERSLLTPDSRFDRWLRGDNTALDATELEGYRLFKAVGCVSCHQGVNIGGNLFQEHGIFRAFGGPAPVLLRVPSLRNIAATPPYFHDGSAPSLEAAVQTMAAAQLGRDISSTQIGQIVAFLGSLTGQYRGVPVTAPR